MRARDLLGASSADAEGVEKDLATGVLTAIEVKLKYEGYVGRERERTSRLTEQSKLLL